MSRRKKRSWWKQEIKSRFPHLRDFTIFRDNRRIAINTGQREANLNTDGWVIMLFGDGSKIVRVCNDGTIRLILGASAKGWPIKPEE